MENIKKFNEYINEKRTGFLGDKTIFSDFKGRDFSITREDGLLRFDFDSVGWLFDTNDVAEGVAIIKKSKYASDASLRKIRMSKEDKQNIKPADSLYWLSGGNKTWKNGNEFNISWDEIVDDIVKEFGKNVIKAVKKSKNLGELIDAFNEPDSVFTYDIFEYIISNYSNDDDDE